jgi:hypothetical protein
MAIAVVQVGAALGLPKKRVCLFELVLLGLGASALAGQNHALIVGGGCDQPDVHRKAGVADIYADKTGPNKGYYNLFRPRFELAAKALTKENGWETGIQYDSDTWERPWPGATSSSQASLEKYLDGAVCSLSEEVKGQGR